MRIRGGETYLIEEGNTLRAKCRGAQFRKTSPGSIQRPAQAFHKHGNTRLKTRGCLYNTGSTFTTSEIDAGPG
jgi:hypothetical protein